MIDNTNLWFTTTPQGPPTHRPIALTRNNLSDIVPLGARTSAGTVMIRHDDVIKWKHFPRYWPFVRGIHRSPVNFPHKGQWRGALMFYLIWINGSVNNREAGDLRRHRAYYDAIVTVLYIVGEKVVTPLFFPFIIAHNPYSISVNVL